MLDVLIRNARVIDGSGVPSYQGSVGIQNGKLVLAAGTEEAT